jgi:hypothetical protein
MSECSFDTAVCNLQSKPPGLHHFRPPQKKSGSTEKIEPLFVSAVFSTFYAFRTTHLLPKKKKAKNEKKANVKNVIPNVIKSILANSLCRIKCFYE